jgi:hypothetical protein
VSALHGLTDTCCCHPRPTCPCRSRAKRPRHAFPLEDLPEELVSYTLAHSELCRHTLARTRQVCAAFKAVVDSHQQQLAPRRWTKATAPATTFSKLRSLDLSATRFEPRLVTAGDVLEQLGPLSGLTQLVISDNRRASLRWGLQEGLQVASYCAHNVASCCTWAGNPTRKCRHCAASIRRHCH